MSLARSSRAPLPVLAAAACLVAAAVAAAVVLRDRPVSFDRLAADAAGVPVPAGVTFAGENRAVNDGPGFTTQRFEEVSRTFTTALPCDRLLADWQAALSARRVRYTVHHYPGPPGVEITIRDGHPEFLGITLGTDGHCGSPFVWAYNSPH